MHSSGFLKTKHKNTKRVWISNTRFPNLFQNTEKKISLKLKLKWSKFKQMLLIQKHHFESHLYKNVYMYIFSAIKPCTNSVWCLESFKTLTSKFLRKNKKKKKNWKPKFYGKYTLRRSKTVQKNFTVLQVRNMYLHIVL